MHCQCFCHFQRHPVKICVHTCTYHSSVSKWIDELLLSVLGHVLLYLFKHDPASMVRNKSLHALIYPLSWILSDCDLTMTTQLLNSSLSKLSVETSFISLNERLPDISVVYKLISMGLNRFQWFLCSVRDSTWMSALPVHSIKCQKALMQVKLLKKLL